MFLKLMETNTLCCLQYVEFWSNILSDQTHCVQIYSIQVSFATTQLWNSDCELKVCRFISLWIVFKLQIKFRFVYFFFNQSYSFISVLKIFALLKMFCFTKVLIGITSEMPLKLGTKQNSEVIIWWRNGGRIASP